MPGSTLLLEAPPGAGKTTRVPLALLQHGVADRIWMLEPRRLAAKAAAERLAATLGESLGGRVGYSVRLESRTSKHTALEVITSGLFLRRLQADPSLTSAGSAAGCVIVDEFHERGADTELALVLLRQARELLNPELRILVMSATLELEGLAQQWPEARVLRSEGRSHPVQIAHQAPRQGESLPAQVVRGLEQHWLDWHGLEQAKQPQTVLIFLPGQREISATAQALAATGWAGELEIVSLHGHLSLAEQGGAIAPARRSGGKLVLATSIAESSLTIEGVSLVIDSGLSRRSRYDPASGMDGLVTVPASQASAEQRRGRAGRLGPGRCLRLWSPAEQQRRPGFDPPELLEVDPLPMALQLAQWGSPLGQGLPWLVPPPTAALAEARELLGQLGALDPEGRLTPHGRRMAQLGLHPRLAHMLLRGAERGWQHLAAELAVLLSERDPLDRREAGCDLGARLAWLRQAPRGQLERLRQDLLRQLNRQRHRPEADPDTTGPLTGPPGPPPAGPPAGPPAEAAALLLSWAYPDRVALRRSSPTEPGAPAGRFLLRNGRGALLHPQDPFANQAALAVAGIDGQGPDGRILLALPLPQALLHELALAEGVCLPLLSWDRQAERVRCEQRLCLGALVLERRPWNDPDPEQVLAVLLEAIAAKGLSCLPWSEPNRQLQMRLQLAHDRRGSPWPPRHAAHLETHLARWLSPHLLGLRSLAELRQIDLGEALWGELGWGERQELERLLPSQLTLPSGRAATLDYSSGTPVLAVKLQEMFGALQNPRVLEGQLPVRLELLSPAGRPTAITDDLAYFWEQTYPQVRRELRGRYPKHPWPEDPKAAVATGLTKRRFQHQNGP